MKYRELITKTLEEQPNFRERHRRVKGFVTLLKQEYVGLREVNPDYLVNFIYDALTMDRTYRLVLSEREDLRGKDYDSKEKVEQEAELALGYEPRFRENLKKINKLI